MLTTEKYKVHGIVAYRFPLNYALSLYNEVISYHSIASKYVPGNGQQMK